MLCHTFSILFLFFSSLTLVFSSTFWLHSSSLFPFFIFFFLALREEHTWNKHIHNMHSVSHSFRITNSNKRRITINCDFLSRLHFINALAALVQGSLAARASLCGCWTPSPGKEMRQKEEWKRRRTRKYEKKKEIQLIKSLFRIDRN